MKQGAHLTLKTAAFLGGLLLGYYLLVLQPRLLLPNKLSQTQNELAKHHTSLLQNKIAFVHLAKLNSSSGNFDFDKTNLVGLIQESNRAGLENASKVDANDLPEVISKLTNRYPDLLLETTKLYEDQQKLLERIFATDSYEAGMQVIKSDESVNLLLVQTKLILEFEEWLAQLRDLQ